MGLEDKINGSAEVNSFEQGIAENFKTVFGEGTANLLLSLISAKAGVWTGPPLSVAAPLNGEISAIYVNPLLTEARSGNGFSMASATNSLQEAIDYINEFLTPSLQNPIVIYGIGDYECEPPAAFTGFVLPAYVSLYAPGWEFSTVNVATAVTNGVLHVTNENYIHIKGIALHNAGDVGFYNNSGSGFVQARMSKGITTFTGAVSDSTGIKNDDGIADVAMHINNAFKPTVVAAGTQLYYQANIQPNAGTGAPVSQPTKDYIEYKAVITQAGVVKPSEDIVRVNTLGITPAWGYSDVGQFTFNASGLFSNNANVEVNISASEDGEGDYFHYKWANGGADSIKIYTADTAGVAANGLLGKVHISIKIWKLP